MQFRAEQRQAAREFGAGRVGVPEVDRHGAAPVLGVVRDGKLLLDCLAIADAEVDEVAAAVGACR